MGWGSRCRFMRKTAPRLVTPNLQIEQDFSCHSQVFISAWIQFSDLAHKIIAPQRGFEPIFACVYGVQYKSGPPRRKKTAFDTRNITHVVPMPRSGPNRPKMGGRAHFFASCGGHLSRLRNATSAYSRIALYPQPLTLWGSHGQAGAAERDGMARFLLSYCPRCLPQPLPEPSVASDLQSLLAADRAPFAVIWLPPMIFSRGRRRRGN